MEKLTSEQLWAWIELEDEEFSLADLKKHHSVSPTSSNFNVYIKRFVEDRKIKRISRGVYRKIKKVDAVKWSTKRNIQPIDFKFPVSYKDGSEFGIEKLVKIYPGDLIIIAGVSNKGKSTFVMNLLGENLFLLPKKSRLMGNEFAQADGKISPKFEERMGNMTAFDWEKDCEETFELFPVAHDYEDYIKTDALNYIDWIYLDENVFRVSGILEASKNRIGYGVLVAVLQKKTTTDHGEGGERTRFFADLEIRIDPFGDRESMLTLGKVKAAQNGHYAEGRRWAFGIVDSGANFINIREVVKCKSCWGKGTVGGKECWTCNGMKYINKEG